MDAHIEEYFKTRSYVTESIILNYKMIISLAKYQYQEVANFSSSIRLIPKRINQISNATEIIYWILLFTDEKYLRKIFF